MLYLFFHLLIRPWAAPILAAIQRRDAARQLGDADLEAFRTAWAEREARESRS